MADVIFSPRYALAQQRNPDLDWLREVILDPFRPDREFGEATLSFADGNARATLILIADMRLGYYLKYLRGEDEWLSLRDSERLTEVVSPDDWEASAGLFVPVEKAWAAILYFCKTGLRSPEIGWIRPEDMPAEGNW